MRGPFHLPADVREGDWIEIGQLGAYGGCLRTAFNGFDRARLVEVRDGAMTGGAGFWSGGPRLGRLIWCAGRAKPLEKTAQPSRPRWTERSEARKVRRLSIPMMPSGHTKVKASTCCNLMPSTVLR